MAPLLKIFITICLLMGSKAKEDDLFDIFVKEILKTRTLGQALIFRCPDGNASTMAAHFKFYSRNAIQTAFSKPSAPPRELSHTTDDLSFKLAVVVDMDCKGAFQVLKEGSNNKRWFFEAVTWLLITSSNELLKGDFLNSLPIEIDSEVYVAIYSSGFRKIRVLEVYVIDGNLHTNMFWYGEYSSWSKKFTLGNFNPYVKPIRRRIDGVKLRVGVLKNHLRHPLAVLNQNLSEDMLKDVKELEPFLLLILQHRLNFRVEPVVRATLEELVQLLEKGEIHLVAAAVDLKPNDRINYLLPTTNRRSYFFFKQPQLYKVLNIYTVPFAKDVMITIAISLLVIVVLLRASIQITSHLRQAENMMPYKSDMDKDDPQWRIGDIVFMTLGAIFQQGADTEPRSTPSRLIFLTLFLLAVLLYTSYSTIVVALLTASKSAITSPETLLKSRFSAGVINSSGNTDYLMTSQDKITKSFVRKKLRASNVGLKYTTIEKAVPKVNNSLFAIYANHEEFYNTANKLLPVKSRCKMTKISLNQNPQLAAMAIRNDFPLKSIFNFWILQTLEVGILTHEKLHRLSYKPPCVAESTFSSLSLDEFRPVLYVIVMGTVVAFVILIVEKGTSLRMKIARSLKKLWGRNQSRKVLR